MNDGGVLDWYCTRALTKVQLEAVIPASSVYMPCTRVNTRSGRVVICVLLTGCSCSCLLT